MSSLLNEELKATGVAPVIIVLKAPPAPLGAAVSTRAAAASATAANLAKYCTTSPLSHEAALVAQKAARPTSRGAAASYSSRPAPPVGASRRRSRAGSITDPTEIERPAVSRGSGDEASPPPSVRVYPNLGLALGTVTREGLAALRADPSVERVDSAPQIALIHPRKVLAASLTSRYTWGIHTLGVKKLWDQGLTGKGVRVGHLDTGVDGGHAALKAAVPYFAEFDEFGRQVLPDPAPWDSDEHGTHTAGTIAGREVSGRFIGIAPGAELASAMVIEGGQVIARVLGGMDWAVGRGVRVLSMSLGLSGYWNDFLPLTQILRQRGVLPVFAAGNEGPGTSRSPGNYSEALSVGASQRGGEVAWFSSSQQFSRTADPLVPDLVGPGVSVISAKPGGGYQSMDGTSMATPHIAALAAILFEARPESTVDEVEQAIFGSCRLDLDMQPERANRGLPNASLSLEMLMAGSEAEKA
jgi:subtilisin